MSMPQIPEEKHRPSLCEVIIDILKSVALEETALSHILNAEGERNQAIAKRLDSCCDEITYKELKESMKQTEKLLNTIIMKEWLLLKKLETANDIDQKLGCRPDCKPRCKEHDCCEGCEGGCEGCEGCCHKMQDGECSRLIKKMFNK